MRARRRGETASLILVRGALSFFHSLMLLLSLSLSLSYLSGDQRDERRAAEEKGHGEAARHGVFEGFGKEEEDWSKTSFSVAERK